jgi:hypothetical protein
VRGLAALPLAVVLALATMGADSCSGTAIETNTTANPTTSESAPTEEGSGSTVAAPPPRAVAPRPVVIHGHGKVVKSINLKTNTPVVVTGHHNGQENFIVDLVGQGQHEFLFNQIGRYEGQAAIEDQLDPGKYRVAIDADGDWTLKFEQPVPKPNAKRLPGTLKGRGARVVAVHTDDAIQPVVRGAHKGQENFIVDVIGYGDLSGTVNLFNEIGRFSGEVLADEELPAGDYLVYVQADGAWTLKFTP